MELDDILDLLVVVWTVLSTLIFAYAVWYAWRRRRLVRKLMADPVVGPQIAALLKEQSEKTEI